MLLCMCIYVIPTKVGLYVTYICMHACLSVIYTLDTFILFLLFILSCKIRKCLHREM